MTNAKLVTMSWDAPNNFHSIIKFFPVPEQFPALHQITIMYCRAGSPYQIAHIIQYMYLLTLWDCRKVP